MQCCLLKIEKTISCYVTNLASEMLKRFFMMLGKLVTFDVSYLCLIYKYIYIGPQFDDHL